MLILVKHNSSRCLWLSGSYPMLYGEVDPVKKHYYVIWLNDGVY